MVSDMEEPPSAQHVSVRRDDVQRVLQDGIDFQYSDGGRTIKPFWTLDATYGSAEPMDALYMTPTRAQRLKNAKDLCKEWCSLIADPNGHWPRLDLAFAERLHFHVKDAQEPPEHYLQQALGLLTRLSATRFTHYNSDDENTCERLDSRYFISQDAPKTIQNLTVVSSIDTNTMKMALHVLVTEGFTAMSLDSYLFFLTEQLEAALHLPIRSQSSASQLLILRGFLWRAWQRATVLHRWYLLHEKLRAGAHMGLDSSLASIGRHLKRLEASAGGPMVDTSPTRTPAYMCRWAFELLRTNRAASGADFGHFLRRYRQAFGDFPARCVPTSTGSFTQCPGQSPTQCRRFAGARIDDQSAHADSCTGDCARLFWDEECYRSVTGARAVSLDPVQDGLLRYCRASGDTMAVSHVWSHGQGGRPEKAENSTGFNACLHRRYSEIARRFGCRSYWMDTPCIPQDHQLRRDAIENINRVFASSRLTLVCDRDIMSIDVHERDIHTYESLLAALLVSDWNVRAWTLLEGYQGAESIHLLCKHDEVIRLTDIIAAIHTAGDVVLANLSMATEHLFPMRASAYTTELTDPEDKRCKPSLEQSGRLLSHRHASRQGDEIVIWSLLRGHLSYTADEFWRSQQIVHTGFLMSDVPRISGTPGLSWAPARPDLPPTAEVSARRRHFASEGATTEVGGITEDGLRAFWLVCAFGDASFRRGARGYLATHVTQIREVVAGRVPLIDSWVRNCEALADYYCGMCLLSAATKRRLEGIVADVKANADKLALLQAVESGPYYTDLPYTYQGDEKDTLLAVVEKNESGNWVWRKMVVWGADVPLPPFTRQRILIQ